MNKIMKYYKYANEFLDCLNAFYDTYKNIIDESVLNKEYDLITDILDDLTYNNCDSWYINFKKNKYRKHIIYTTDKECWKKLSKLYRKMWKITFGF